MRYNLNIPMRKLFLLGEKGVEKRYETYRNVFMLIGI